MVAKKKFIFILNFFKKILVFLIYFHIPARTKNSRPFIRDDFGQRKVGPTNTNRRKIRRNFFFTTALLRRLFRDEFFIAKKLSRRISPFLRRK